MQIIDGHGTAYTWDEADISFLATIKRYKKRGKHGRKYVNVLAAFDIETSDSPETESAFMYHWQFAYVPGPGSEEVSRGRGRSRIRITEPIVIMGRTWAELVSFMRRICDTLPSDVYLPVYVHNLSYEYHFANHFLQITDGFLVGDKIGRIWSDIYQIEWRCSLLATNKSLRLLTAGRVPHEKAEGDLDYSVYREPTTPLTMQELGYCYNDVAGLVEAMRLELQLWDENIASMPMTSTGHVRKDISRVTNGYMHKVMERSVMPFDLAYKMHKGFRGGDCHGNRDAIGMIWHDIGQYDRKSSYPAVLIVHKYPIGAFLKMRPEDWKRAAYSDNYACFGKIRIRNLRIKRESPDPYIPLAKCETLKDFQADNGRVLFADELTIYITDLDYQIIEKCYDYDYEILECWAACAGYLPKAFTDLILKYFLMKETLGKRRKEEIKANGRTERYKLLSEEYEKAKNLLNSLYGCLAEWIHPEEWGYLQESHDFGALTDWEELTPDERKDLMAAAWDKRNRTRLPYQWGVWCTAWARWEYFRGIMACHVPGNGMASAFVYGDTDSNKFIDSLQVRENYAKLNESIRKRCEEQPYTKGYIDLDGERKYLGVWEDEGTASLFRTWGAKKYIERFADGRVECTVAGLSKTGGSEYFRMLGGVHAFNPGDDGLLVPEAYAGRLTAHYSPPIEPHIIKLRSGAEMETAGFVRLLPTTYKLNLKEDLADLLQLIQYTGGQLTKESKSQWLIDQINPGGVTQEE